MITRRTIAAVAAVAAMTVAGCSTTTDGNPVRPGSKGDTPTFHKEWIAKIAGQSGSNQQLTGASADKTRVYANDVSGKVYALDAKTGKTVWTAQPGSRTGTAVGLAGGLVFYYDSNYKTAALDPASGKVLWSRSSSDSNSTDVYHPAVADGIVTLQPYPSSTVQGVDARTGKVRWSLGDDDDQRYSFSEPSVVSDGKLFYAIGRKYATSTPYLLYAITPRTGKVQWSIPLPKIGNAKLYAAGGKVILHNADSENASQLTAYDPATRKQVWQASLDDVSPSTFSPAITADALVFGANKGVQGVALADGKKFTSKVTGPHVGVCGMRVCVTGLRDISILDDAGAKVGSLDQPDESESIPDPVLDNAGRTYLTDSSTVYAYD